MTEMTRKHYVITIDFIIPTQPLQMIMKLFYVAMIHLLKQMTV